MKFIILSLAVLVAGVVCEDASSTAAPELTPCQAAREHALNTKSEVNLVPECDDNGDYKNKQCYTSGDFCLCMDKKGHPLTSPRNNLKTCDCYVKRDEAIKNGGMFMGHHVYKCERDGTFTPRQCFLESIGPCWCIDQEGKRITNPAKPEEVKC